MIPYLEQFEPAAREYCRLMGLDPGFMVSLDPPGPDGSLGPFVPRWEKKAWELQVHHAMTQALASHPPERSQK